MTTGIWGLDILGTQPPEGGVPDMSRGTGPAELLAPPAHGADPPQSGNPEHGNT